MSKAHMQKIVPHLWYTKEAEEAARFYASLFPNSRVDRVTALPADSPSGPAARLALSSSRCAASRSWPSAPAASMTSTMRSRSL